MLSLAKGFLKEEDGMGTVEVVLILACLVAIALIFKNTVTEWVRDTMDKIFESKKDVEDIDSGLLQDSDK